MTLDHIHGYLVRPNSSAGGTSTVRGITVPLSGPLYHEMTRIFSGADAECKIDIIFAPDTRGQQNNAAHDRIVQYARNPSEQSGRAIAEMLQQATPGGAGIGLLFLLKGQDLNKQDVLVVSRFPAEGGIIAHETSQSMTVDFVERVFRKRSTGYKSVLFKTSSLSTGFQVGRAIDRQANAKVEIAKYWIGDFLSCELNLQGPLGSRRLGIAISEAVKNADDPDIKREIFAVATTIRNQDGRTDSGNNHLRRSGASDAAIHAIVSEMPNSDAMNEVFPFETNEFDQHVRYRIVELDNGALLAANHAEFGEVFEMQEFPNENRHRFSTSGTILKERYRKLK